MMTARMQFGRVWLVLVLAAAAQITNAQNLSSTVLSDGDFYPGSGAGGIGLPPAPNTFIAFQTSVVMSGAGGAAPVAVPRVTGGNPDRYMEIQLSVNAGSQSNPAIVGMVFLFQDALLGVAGPTSGYTPAAEGAIDHLDYSEDAINVGPGVGMQQGGLVIQQDNILYGLRSFLLTVPATWTNVGKTGLKSSDFIPFDASHAGKTPDFSATGGAITFGFWRGLTSKGSASCGMYCMSDGSFSSTQGIDNWTVTISHGSPLPTSTDIPNSVQTDDPISTATGELLRNESDLSLGGPLPVRFSRHHGSLLKTNGFTSALGDNWMHNFDVRLSIGSGLARARLFPGKTVTFASSGTPQSPTWKLSSVEQVPYQLVTTQAGYQLFDPTAKLIYTFLPSGLLSKVEDRNGNALTLSWSGANPGPDQVADGLGRSLNFVYSGGRLMRVQDQASRSITFGYNSGRLASSTDANGKTTRYSYTDTSGLAALMTSAMLPAGNVPATQSYDANGRVIKQTDSRGYSFTLAYNTPRAGTTTVTDALGAKFQHVYDASLNLAGDVDPAGQNTAILYDKVNRRSAVTDRMGYQRTTAYDPASGLPASITDQAGGKTTISYLAQQQGPFTSYQVSKIVYPDGSSVAFSYDAAGNILTATDAAGKVTVYSYNSRGQVLAATNSAGGVTKFTFNPDGTQASVTLPVGDITTFTYDSKKRLSKMLFPDQSVRTIAYDDAGNVVEAVNENGKASRYGYDENEHIRSATDAEGKTATISYNGNGWLNSITDASGKSMPFEYNEAGALKGLILPTGERVSVQLDSQFRLTSVAYCSGKGYQFGYNKDGVISSVADGLGRTWAIATDKLRRITGITSPLAHSFQFTYDARGRLTSAADPLGYTTSFARDSRGLLTGVAQGSGAATTISRDDLGNAAAITDPNGSQWLRSYDTQGRLVSKTDPLSRVMSYKYDSRGRTTEIDLPEGSLALSNDPAGNLTRRSYSDGTDVSFTYDGNNRPVSASGIALAYDVRGNIVASNGLIISRDDAYRIASVNYADGKQVTYSYDCNGLLAQIVDWAGGVTQFSYDEARQLTAIARPNGVTTQFAYDLDGRLAAITETNTAVMSSIAFERDAAGRVVSEQQSVPQSPVPAGGASQFAYDAASQITGAAYDSMGRPVSLGVRNYSWDLMSRLISYSGADGQASFSYDAYGMRTSRTTPSGAQSYVWNYAFPLPALSVVRDDSGDRRYYIYLPDGTLLYSMEADSNARHFYHFSEAGSTLFLTDDNGAVTDTYGITPYGEQVDATGTTENPFTFLGKFGVMQEGATGLYFMRFRYYDSATARFLTRQSGSSTDPKLVNPYQYAQGNPLALTDPIGQGADAGRMSNLSESDLGQFLRWLPEALSRGSQVLTGSATPLRLALWDFFRGAAFRKEINE